MMLSSYIIIVIYMYVCAHMFIHNTQKVVKSTVYIFEGFHCMFFMTFLYIQCLSLKLLKTIKFMFALKNIFKSLIWELMQVYNGFTWNHRRLTKCKLFHVQIYTLLDATQSMSKFMKNRQQYRNESK